MGDAWNQAAEAQELSETVQRLVNEIFRRKKMWFEYFRDFTQFQSENINEVSLGTEVKPQTEDGEEPK